MGVMHSSECAKSIRLTVARSTLAQWVGACGAQLQPMVKALDDELRRHVVLHAHETPMLKPKHLGDAKAYPT